MSIARACGSHTRHLAELRGASLWTFPHFLTSLLLLAPNLRSLYTLQYLELTRFFAKLMLSECTP